MNARLKQLILECLGESVLDSEGEFRPQELGHSVNDEADVNGQWKSFISQLSNEFRMQQKKISILEKTLEISSRELNDVNTHITQSNETLNAMLNSLESGFLLFDSQGICSHLVSQSAIDMLSRNPRGEKLNEVLKIPDEKISSFWDWYSLLIEEMVPFDDLASLAPNHLLNSETKSFDVQFRAVRDVNEQVSGVLLVIKDITEACAQVKESKRLENQSKMIRHYLRDKPAFLSVIEHLRLTADHFKHWNAKNEDAEGIAGLIQRLHTLKGAAGNFAILSLFDKIHDWESLLSQSLYKNSSDLKIQKTVQDLSQEMHGFREELLQGDLDFLEEKDLQAGGIREISNIDLQRLFFELKSLHAQEPVLQRYIDRLLAVPIKDMFSSIEAHFPSRAIMVNKEVQLVIEGDLQYRIFSDVYEPFFLELSHLINNCIDHGIELPSDRRTLGKESIGQVHVSVSVLERDSKIRIQVSDDGQGIDIERLRKRCSKMGMDCENWSDSEVIQSIFQSGVSSQETVDHFSGRGMGMSSLKSVIEDMGGEIHVKSKEGQGTKFEMTLPILRSDSPLVKKFEKVGA